MTTQHTPPPWIVDLNSPYVGRICAGEPGRRYLIATAATPPGDDLRGHRVTRANARLIGAAPDMWDLLQRVEEDWGELFDIDEPMNGGDCCEWLCQFIKDARPVLAQTKED